MSAENLFFMANASDLEYDEDDDDKSIYSLCSSDDFDIECQSEQDEEGAVTRMVDSKTSMCIENVIVTAKMGELSKEKVDVLVNSTSKSLKLDSGRASKALSEAAGPSMQKECNIKYKSGVVEGEVAITGGGNLKCTMVYHGSVLKWKTPNCEKVHKVFISTCLEELHKSKLGTIAFPAIGTGYLNFPYSVVAKNMLSCIKEFIATHNITTLKEVRIVIYPKDVKTYEAFRAHMKKIQIADERKEVQVVTKVVSTATSGNLTITLIEGRITDQKADVLVNSATRGLKLDQGQLSQAILEAGGKSIQEQCQNKYPKGIKHGEIAVTDGGSLPCKAIYHGTIPVYGKKGDGNLSADEVLLSTIIRCLEEAHGQGFTSLVFPAFGTGYLHYPKHVAGRVMIKGINDFGSNHPDTSLTDIRIVVYPAPGYKDVLRSFEDEAKKGGDEVVRVNPTPLPARGTKSFCRVKYREEIFPPTNWTKFSCNKSVKDWRENTTSDKFCELVQTDKSTSEKVKQLVDSTWELDKVGHGKDAVGLGHTKIKVIKVERIENLDQYEKYAGFRSQLFDKAHKQGIFPKLENIKNSKGFIRTTEEIDKSLTVDLCEEINEHYFFHGTKLDRLDAILAQGFDFRMAGDRAMFGKAAYFAESSTKADQYADPKGQRSDSEKKMILARVCMGEMYVTATPKVFKRAPCAVKTCGKDVCSHCEQDHFDSVVGDGQWIFREFIVYERHQSYPEYLITYVRV
ncbi:hypothetical protein ScPMuIL_011435 [Solemya velum]